MFNNELLSDVSFVVPVQLDEISSKKCWKAISAHKFVLAISSPVFFAMFYGDLAEKSDSIRLPDCEYESLLELFRFVYCDEARLTPDNVMQVLYLAKKYILPSLVERCTEYLLEVLNVSNVFCVLSHALNYGEKKLVSHCWKVIDKEAEEAVKTEGFETIDRSLLEDFVKRDSLNIKEVDLFRAVDTWAVEECKRLDMAANGASKRLVLGDKVVNAIRFPVMKRNEFSNSVLDCNILTSHEAIIMEDYFNTPIFSPPNYFSKAPRTGLRQRCCRFKSVVLETGLMYGSYHSDYLYFSVNRDIVLYGICLFGSENRKYQATVTVRKASNGLFKATKIGKYSSIPMELEEEEGSFYAFDVLFDKPVSLKKNTWYYVKAAMSGPIIWHGKGGVKSIHCPGVQFSFKDHPKNNKRTNIADGQFPQFLFSLE